MSALSGQSALITGVGGGFGRAIALAIADAGAAVTLMARSDGVIGGLADQIREKGGHAQFFTGDVRDLADTRQIYDAHKSAHGIPDILINSASLTEPYGPVGVVDPVQWWNTLAVHVLGAFNYMTVALPDMRAAGRGRIINIASLDGETIRPNQSGYCVAKAAQIRLSEHVTQETAGSGVFVFAVHPGIAISPVAETMLENEDARRWIPDFIEAVKETKAHSEQSGDHRRCGIRCVALASGRFDHLAGPLINFHTFEPETT